MRLTRCFLLVLSIVGTAQAEDSPALQLKGHARVRHEFSDHADYAAVRNMTFLRVRPQVLWRTNPKSWVLFEPQFTRTMGERTVSAASTTGTADQTSGTTADPSLGVHQAYLGYKTSDAFRIMVGRQIISFGDELILGALEWNNVSRSFDALRVQHQPHAGYLSDTFWAKLVEANATASGTGDYDFYGTHHSWKFDSWFKEFDTYFFYLNDTRGEAADPTRLGSVGVRAKTLHGSWDTRLEATRQFGRVANTPSEPNGTQADFEVGKTWAALNSVRLGLGGFYADEDYNQLFPTAHKWLGIVDVFGRRNIMGPRAQSTWVFSDDLKINADFHHFYRVDRNDTAYKLGGTALAGSRSEKKFLGSEVDVVAHYAVDEQNALQGGGGIFFASSSMRQVRSENPIFGYVSWEMKF